MSLQAPLENGQLRCRDDRLERPFFAPVAGKVVCEMTYNVSSRT